MGGTLALAALLCPMVANAQGGKEKDTPADETAEKVKIGVYVEGFSSNKFKRELLEILPPEFEVIEDFTFKREMIRNQAKLPVGIVLTLKDKRGKFIEGTRKALAKLDAKAAVIGTVRPGKGGGMEIYFVIVPRDEGDLPYDGPIAVGKGDNSAALGGGTRPPRLSSFSRPRKFRRRRKRKKKRRKRKKKRRKRKKKSPRKNRRIAFHSSSAANSFGSARTLNSRVET